MERMSKDAAKVLYALHSQYQSRRKVGQSKADACQFGSCKSIHDDLCSDMPLQDVDESMRIEYQLNLFLMSKMERK